MKEKKKFVYIFFGIIFVVSFLDMIKSEKIFSNLENRYLKRKPLFSIKKFIDGSYNKEINEYVSDQFIGRDKFINIKSLGESFLGKIENNNIIYGKEGYMFYKTDTIDKVQIEKNIRRIKDFIDNNNLDNSVIFVPYSSTIYKEYLPKGLNLINEEEIINKSYSNIGINNSINIVDILNKNKNEKIYYKTDHHWTTYGSYLGYLRYCEAKAIKPLKINELNENNLNGFLGSYYRRAKKYNSEEETIKYYDMNNLSMSIDGKIYNSLYEQINENNDDKYSIFLKGNNPLTIIKNNNESVSGKKLIVFKDSFANSIVPFIANHYEEVHVIDLRYFNEKISEYITKYKFSDSLILYSVNSLNKDSSIIKIGY